MKPSKEITKQSDLFGRTPVIDDCIIFNPPKYKGLKTGRCTGFTKAGLPIVQVSKGHTTEEVINTVPKTGFVIRGTFPDIEEEKKNLMTDMRTTIWSMAVEKTKLQKTIDTLLLEIEVLKTNHSIINTLE